LLSFGVHPWYADKLNDTTFEILNQCLKHPSAVAIGECGLDKLKGPSMNKQIDILNQQALLAQSMQKALIIHCVKAWPELFYTLRDIQTPIVLHGYSGSLSVTKLALNFPNLYFSIGRLRKNEWTKMQENFRCIPLNRILAENDVSGVALAEIYGSIERLSGFTSENLNTCIQENFQRVFGSIRFAPNFS
jgi:TatD DNase family protein